MKVEMEEREEREEASQMDSSYQKLFGKKLQLEMWKRMSGRRER